MLERLLVFWIVARQACNLVLIIVVHHIFEKRKGDPMKRNKKVVRSNRFIDLIFEIKMET